MKSLENLFLLSGLTDKQKKEIIKSFNPPSQFKKGDIIYSADKFPDAIGYILSGKAEAVTNNSHNLLMRTFESGSCFGVAAIFGGGERYVSTVTAKSDTAVQFITESQLKSIFLNYPVTALNYIDFLSSKIRFLNNKLSVISCGSTEDTVLKHLISSADSNNTLIPKSMTSLAKTLGIGRASLYRSLENLEREGIISRENNIIKVIKNEKNS